MKYDLILADCPWSYQDTASHGAAIAHYNTMKLEDLKRLEISRITSDNSLLFMWATYPCLEEALEVMKCWGFKYKTVAFTWIKLNKNGKPFFGIGHYTGSNAEIVLIGKRGKGLPRINKDVNQVILSQRGKHSKKPIEVFQRINRLYGDDIKRIELFAREKQPEWDATGLELDGRDIRDFLNRD